MSSLSKFGLWAGSVALAMVVGAGVWDWYHPPKDRTIYRASPAPYVAPRATIPGLTPQSRCIPTVVLVPSSPAEKAKVEKRLGGELVPGDLLTLRDIFPMPYGGRIGVVVPPPTPETPNPEAVVQVFPKKAPFLEWLPSRELTVGYGVGLSGDLRRVWMAEFRQDVVRVGPVIVGGRLGIQDFQGSDTRGYALLTASVKF